jgi:uncharacterized OB-fold protein
VTEPEQTTFGDAITAPFWEAAREHRLLVQRCSACGTHQSYARPFCLACDRDDTLEWIDATGAAVVHSVVTVRMSVVPELEPPYQVAIVELAEGPRLTTNIIGRKVAIGDAVRVTWRERLDGLPPVPVFEAPKERS